MKRYFLILVTIIFLHSSGFCQETNSNTLLWRIDDKDNGAPSYLFGTLHLPQKKFVVYTDSVYVAIQNTDIIYNEVDFFSQSLFGDTSMLKFYEDKKHHLDSVQKTDSWKRMIDKVNRKYNIHLNYDSTEQFVVFSQQLMTSIYEPEDDMTLPDMLLAKHAIMMGKKTGGLETLRLQFAMIYDLLDARLNDTTMDLNDEAALTNSLKKFYINEQLDSITKAIYQINPSYRKIVFDNRNRTMSDSIEKHSREKPSFFAIGAGHLGGQYGVIELLRKKGFTLTPVHSENKISLLIINNMLKIYDHMQMTMNQDATDAPKDSDTVQPPPPPPLIFPKNVKAKPVPKKKP